MTSELNMTFQSKVYRNMHNGIFFILKVHLRQFGNDFAYGDYDNDGKIDVIVSGWNGSSGITKLYHNDGNGIFSQTNIVFPPAQNASFSWIDYDKDNDKDLLMMAGGGCMVCQTISE